MRLIQGHSGPHAPPLVEEEIEEVPRGEHDNGHYQSANPGSYALIPSWKDVSCAPDAGIQVELYFQPYLLQTDQYCQSLISCLDVSSRTGFAVILRNSRLAILLGTGNRIEALESRFPVNRWRWIHVHLEVSGRSVSSKIEQLNRLVEKSPSPEVVTETLGSPLVLGSNALLFGAAMFRSPDELSARPSCFYNGRLDSPSVASSGTVIARYDFSMKMTSDAIVDTSGNRRHGYLVNSPTRAVKGHD